MSFVVKVGGSLYLDESGKLTTGPADDVQVYLPPQGIHFEAKKLEDAFKELGGLLPSSAEDIEAWVGYGASRELVTLLSSVAGLAKIAATAVSVYVWAVGVMLSIMSMLMEDDGLSPELAKVLYSLKGQVTGLEQIARASDMVDMHANLDGRIDVVDGLLRRLSVEKPTGAARAAIFAEMRHVVDEVAVPLSRIRDQEWAATYDADSNKGRGFLAGLLVFQRSDGTVPAVPMAPPTVTRFDYRFGVPMLLFTATTYTTLARVAMPWFRSSGSYVSQLRKTADAIDRFVVRMQDECLARTLYSSDNPPMLLQQRLWPVFEIPMGGGPKAWNTYHAYAVGAFDLVRYDDKFLMDCFARQFAAGEEIGPRGLFNYHWWPPENSDDDVVAAAANAKSADDYARLQMVSGMLHLVHMAATLRFLSTPPDRSQTVDGSARDSRALINSASTTATSPSVLPKGVIESPATRKRYAAAAVARIRTQEPGYVPSFRYRVVLRTLRSSFGSEGWRHLDYVGDVWRPGYESTQAEPRVKRLRTEFFGSSVLSEVVLYEGIAPTVPVHLAGERTINASTFDWYLPVGRGPELSDTMAYADQMPLRILGAVDGTAVATGGVSPYLLGGAATSRELADTSPLAGHLAPASPPEPPTRGMTLRAPSLSDVVDVDAASAFAERALDAAERRHVAEEHVQLAWELDWADGRLDVRLRGHPDNRPFQVYVVVEEVVFSGDVIDADLKDASDDVRLTERLQTAFLTEIVNEVIEVPHSFFTAEHRALVEAAKRWREFLSLYAEDRPIGPSDPIEQHEREMRELAKASQSTATLAETVAAHAAFAERTAPALWSLVTEATGNG